MNDTMIFAIEGDLVFDAAYAENMKLPFDQGWDRWAVFKRDGDNFTKLYESANYTDCEEFRRQ
jgi:hypothetical protein